MLTVSAYPNFELHMPYVPDCASLLLDWFQTSLRGPLDLTHTPYGYSFFNNVHTPVYQLHTAIQMLRDEPIPFSIYMGLYDLDIKTHNITGSMEYRHYRYSPYGDLMITRGFCFESDIKKNSYLKPTFEGQEDNVKAYKLKKLLEGWTLNSVYVALVLLAEQKHLLIQLLDEIGKYGAKYWEGENKVRFDFYEVINGQLEFLPELQKQGIAYNSSWDRGVDFDHGTEYCRFTKDGKKIVKTIFDYQINPSLHELIKLKDRPKRLRDFVLKHEKKLEVLPWDNQVEYGKIYSLRQLITS